MITTTGDSGHVVVTPSPRAYSFTTATAPRMAETEMRKMEADMRRLGRSFRLYAPIRPIPPMHGIALAHEEKLDPKVLVKLEALYAIGETREDETSFQTLKDVALDHSENTRLRQAAIEILSDFKKYDVTPIFIELARRDTNERIQEAAIEFIAHSGKDKNTSIDALVVLFNSLPTSRKERRETILYTIADVGNDKAVDFLSSVARTHEDFDLRSDAVYYLGTIGGERARTALYQILKSK
jgi:HEAT repeat protein